MKQRRKSAGVLGFVRSLLPNLFQSEDQEVEEEVVDDNEVRKTTITGKTSAGSEELQSETRHDERNTSVYPPSSLASVLEQKNREPEATPNGRPSSFWQEVTILIHLALFYIMFSGGVAHTWRAYA